jgi:predicted Rossmann fold flavoprotein
MRRCDIAYFSSMNPYDVLIVGAGPSGMFAAIKCACQGLRVCIVEKTDSAGKKLLLAGSGKCNLTHRGLPEEFLAHYGDKGRFVKPALYNFTGDDLRGFFEKKALKMVEANDGKIFPATMKSRDVLRVLLDECVEHGVEIRYNEPVRSIAYGDGGYEVLSEHGRYSASAVVIATGGKSYPQTGSTGDGYTLAKMLGHTIAAPAPALASIVVRDFAFASCAGISLAGAKLFFFRNGKKLRTSRGDILFTHQGLSGPGILDFSRYVEPGDVVAIALVDYDKKESFERDLLNVAAGHGKWPIKTCMASYRVPQRLFDRVFEVLGIPLDCTASSFDKKTRKLIIDNFMEFPFAIARPGDFSEAMVTRGGVSLQEIVSSTMESRIAPQLYFAGEVVNVDGDTGGYNLQFAFSSAALAAASISRTLQKDPQPQ